jgi:hypothetical protein
MATRLEKPVVRQGQVPVYGRTLVVTLYPGDLIGLRPSRSRKEFTTTLGAVYSMAVRAEIAAAKAAKKKGKTK